MRKFISLNLIKQDCKTYNNVKYYIKNKLMPNANANVHNIYASHRSRLQFTLYYCVLLYTCADPESLSERVKLNKLVFLLIDDGSEDLNTTISGPSPARQQIAIRMLFEWRFAGVPMMAQHRTLTWLHGSNELFRESGPVLLRNPIFLFFRDGARNSCPPLWIRA